MDEQPVRYVFGDIVVALDAESVSRGGVPVTLEPKAFRLLVFLIENRGGSSISKKRSMRSGTARSLATMR